jgi:AbiV family abortive infection protein
LSAPQRAQLARAALDNAAELLSDARVLLEAGRWPRAYALAVLSAEEFGKFHSCVVAGSYESDDAAAWAGFWRKFTSHRPKLTTWAGQLVDLLDWGPVGSKGDAEWKRAWDDRKHTVDVGLNGKLASLYVDFDNGKVNIPRDLLTEETARVTVDAVAAVVEPATVSFRGDLTLLVTPRPEIRALFTKMREAKTQHDRQVAAQAFLDWFKHQESEGVNPLRGPEDLIS